jgi:hypothetical protein
VIGRPHTARKSISYPARKNSIANPNCDTVSNSKCSCASPNTCGPMRIPSTISTTTLGNRTHRSNRSTSNGADRPSPPTSFTAGA